jgi:hypothetical protein
MIRPEAKAQLWRWREVLAGVGAASLGAWWIAGGSALLLLPGIALGLAGAALIWIGVQRARFRSEGQGPGTVEVDEGSVTYFGPLTGGTVALRELDQIAFDPSQHPPHWRLFQSGTTELLIPVNASGADALFDAFATLPDFRMEQALNALKAQDKHRIVIWRRRIEAMSQLSRH